MKLQFSKAKKGLSLSEWHISKRWTAISGAVVLVTAFYFWRLPGNHFSLNQLQTQDLPTLFLLGGCIFAAAFWAPEWVLPRKAPATGLILLLGLAVVALLTWGTYTLMGNFPLSRDEHMVVFDMAVYDRWRFAAPLAPEWRPYARALVPGFLLNEVMPTGLVSGYHPMNAVLRLAFSKVADPAWFNPILVVVGAVGLFDIARRQFGRDDPALWVVLLIYFVSAQLLTTAMTTYAMTAHLALNMVWLAAFLRGGKAGHAVAIFAGLLAVGLHQVVFHPFFVAPFLLWRLREGEVRLVLSYVAAYLMIVIGWWLFPLLAASHVAPTIAQAPGGNLLARIYPLLMNPNPNAFLVMVVNLMRFFAWQNFALLPLLVAAVPLAARQAGLLRPLLLGIVLWLAFLFVVLPYQGHGWGYRYLHPFLGSFALIAGFGYRDLKTRLGTRADGLVLLLSGVTAIVAVPLQLAATYAFVEPHVRLERFIARQRVPMVLIDTYGLRSTDNKWAANAIDHVRNDPDLKDRPLRFASHALNPALLAGLCRGGPITLITRADQHWAGFSPNSPEHSPRFEALVERTARQAPDCFRSAQRGQASNR